MKTKLGKQTLNGFMIDKNAPEKFIRQTRGGNDGDICAGTEQSSSRINDANVSRYIIGAVSGSTLSVSGVRERERETRRGLCLIQIAKTRAK